MHLAPRKVAKKRCRSVDMLYPPGKSCRIPIIYNITGTNGKTTTTRLLAHIVKNNGFKVGLPHQMLFT
jgi:cyanophycin synthetase